MFTPNSSSMLSSFANKVIAKGRCLDLNFLEHEGFQIGQKLRNLGLEPFCSLNLSIYPNLIKKFLSVAVHFESGYKGNLRGIKFILTPSLVSTFLNLPRHENAAYMADPRMKALNAELGTDDSEPAIIIFSNDLEAEPRLLLNIVHCILFFKSGAFEYISERDLAIMYHIIDEIPFDFPKMFLTYLSEAISQTKMNVSYGMAFTKIFRKSGVRISSYEPKKVLKHADFYTLGTLTRMSFKKEERIWTRKVGFDPHHSTIPPPSALRTSASPPPSTSISPPPREPIPPFTDTQTPLTEPQPSTSLARRFVYISLDQVKELVSSISDTFISQLQTI